MTTNNLNAPKPGYSVIEEQIIRAMLSKSKAALQDEEWKNNLHFEAKDSFVLELTGNQVNLTIHINKRFKNKVENSDLIMFLKVHIVGKEDDSWPYVDGGFYLLDGSKNDIISGILKYENNLEEIKEKLFEDYYATFNYSR